MSLLLKLIHDTDERTRDTDIIQANYIGENGNPSDEYWTKVYVHWFKTSQSLHDDFVMGNMPATAAEIDRITKQQMSYHSKEEKEIIMRALTGELKDD